jgi:spore maturation protein CgeB
MKTLYMKVLYSEVFLESFRGSLTDYTEKEAERLKVEVLKAAEKRVEVLQESTQNGKQLTVCLSVMGNEEAGHYEGLLRAYACGDLKDAEFNLKKLCELNGIERK